MYYLTQRKEIEIESLASKSSRTWTFPSLYGPSYFVWSFIAILVTPPMRQLSWNFLTLSFLHGQGTCYGKVSIHNVACIGINWCPSLQGFSPHCWTGGTSKRGMNMDQDWHSIWARTEYLGLIWVMIHGLQIRQCTTQC